MYTATEKKAVLHYAFALHKPMMVDHQKGNIIFFIIPSFLPSPFCLLSVRPSFLLCNLPKAAQISIRSRSVYHKLYNYMIIRLDTHFFLHQQSFVQTAHIVFFFSFVQFNNLVLYYAS